MTISLVIAFVIVIAALQGLSVLLTGLETAAQRIEGRSTWISNDGTKFEEFSVSQLEASRVMQRDFEESGADLVWDAAVPAHS